MAADRVADVYARQLDLVERSVLSLAEAMPAADYDFRPTEGAFTGVRTFGEQVRHLATMMYMTAAIVLREQSPYGPGPGDNGPAEITGKDAAVAYLKGALAYARRAAASLTDATHLEPRNTYFGPQPAIEVANGLLYHSYNHYGQMVVYARMRGVVPPESR